VPAGLWRRSSILNVSGSDFISQYCMLKGSLVAGKFAVSDGTGKPLPHILVYRISCELDELGYN
jgi:hypothetical protein